MNRYIYSSPTSSACYCSDEILDCTCKLGTLRKDTLNLKEYVTECMNEKGSTFCNVIIKSRYLGDRTFKYSNYEILHIVRGKLCYTSLTAICLKDVLNYVGVTEFVVIRPHFQEIIDTIKHHCQCSLESYRRHQ